MSMNSAEYVATLVNRAKKAQAIAESFSQDQVDELCAAIAYNGTRQGFATQLSKMLVNESKMGLVEDKYAKMMTKIKGTYRDMKNKKSVGIIERNEALGLIKLAKPVGVIGAFIPVTNGEATPFCKAISAIKGRNAIILSPHPRAKKTNQFASDTIRATLKKYDVPEDLVIGIDPEYVSVEVSGELMKQVDLVLATGGTPMLKAAYSSGTPAIGVGTGNASVIVDGTTDLNDVANMIMQSKTFDYSTSCSAENNVIVSEKVYDDFMDAMKKQGGYLISNNSLEKIQLEKTVWPDGHTLNKDIVAQPVEKIAEIANIVLSQGTKFMMVEEDGVGKNHKFCAEKLSVITTLHKYSDFDEALDQLEAILEFKGQGHSCGIHTKHDYRVIQLAEKIKASRIMVNQPQCLANSGAWTNGMPMSMTLGCGTWGNSSVSHNVTWKDLINTTWVSYPIESTQPTDEELFPKSVVKFNR